MSLEDDIIENGFSDKQDYLDYLMNKADADWEKQGEQERKQGQWEEYLASLSENDVESLNEEDEQRRKQLRIKREIILEEDDLFKLWKKKNPDECKIWEAMWSFKCYTHAYLIDNSGINEIDEWKKWKEERNLNAEEKKEYSQMFSMLQKDRIKENIISDFLQWSSLDENTDINEIWNDFNKWINDHVEEWNTYRRKLFRCMEGR